jgi:hypothetical protein
MAARQRSPYNPLEFIPSPEVIKQHLDETELLAERLRILLRVSREINDAKQPIAAVEANRYG